MEKRMLVKILSEKAQGLQGEVLSITKGLKDNSLKYEVQYESIENDEVKTVKEWFEPTEISSLTWHIIFIKDKEGKVQKLHGVYFCTDVEIVDTMEEIQATFGFNEETDSVDKEESAIIIKMKDLDVVVEPAEKYFIHEGITLNMLFDAIK